MKRLNMLSGIAIATLFAIPALAHHSFAAVYKSGESVTIEGKVVQFLFRNPHSVRHVVTEDEDGNTTRWAIEWQGASQLGASGISTQTLRPGDPVIVTGTPGRIEAEHRMLLVRLQRTTDGLNWGNRAGEVVN
jgi:hypothetical protein